LPADLRFATRSDHPERNRRIPRRLAPAAQRDPSAAPRSAQDDSGRGK
jgi:hypothetical protein